MRIKVTAFLVCLFLVLGFATSQSVLEKDRWNNAPTYFQDSSVDVRFSDDIEVKEAYQVCSSYESKTYENGTDYQDCVSYTTNYRGGQNEYIFRIENIDYYYIGNGNVHLSFDIVRNNLTKELYQSQLNPVQEQQFIDYFNTDYLFRDQALSSSGYDNFLDWTESVSVSSLGDSLKAKDLETKNLMASSNSRIETVVELEDFRNGGAKINDVVTVEVVS